MKRKILLVLAIMSLLACVFAITAFADGIVANTVTSETYGTVYQLNADPGLDGADAYVSVLNTIDDQGTDKTSLSILYDGTYYYVFPSSYLVDELSNGKFSFTLTMGAGNNFSSKQKGINNVFAEWNEAEGTALPTFEVTGTWGSTKVNSLVRFELPTDIKFIDGAHCLIKGDALVEVVFNHSISCPSGVFSGNASLTTVKGFEKLTNFSKTTHTFRNCTSLTSIKLPSDVTSIGTEVFYGCKQLTGIENWDEIKGNITTIGNYAFYDCDSLVSISLPAVTSIGSAAFGYSDSLKAVDLEGASFVKLNSAFRNCPALESITLPDTVDGISQDGFHGCKALTSIKIPAACTYLGAYAFNGCSNLTSIDMTAAVNLKSTSNNTFNGTAITELVFPESFESFGGFGSASKLVYVYFPNSTKTLGGIQNGKMPTYTIPLGVTELKSKTLDYGSTSTVIIHKGVATVSSSAFYGMSNTVKTIIYTGSETDAVVEQIKVAAPKAEIIYADQCETYFSTHAWSGNATMQKVNYFEGVFFADTCTREGCGVGAIDDTRTIGALFIDYGYSATEAPINGTYSMSQFYGINREVVEQYKAVVNADFEFGFVVAANSDPFGAVESGELASDKIFIAEEKFFAFDYISVKVSGISETTMDKAVAFCMFVRDGEVYYLDGGKTVDTVTMKSYNDLVSTAE